MTIKTKRFRLADLGHVVPMPDRGGRIFAQTEIGETINPELPFYAQMIGDGDIVPVSDTVSKPDTKAKKDT